MSDRINQLIDSIREKTLLLHEKATSEQNENQKLSQEILMLKEQIVQKDEKISELNNSISDLKESMEAAKEQSITKSVETGVSDEQIDELVKEIEYCIGQLKK